MKTLVQSSIYALDGRVFLPDRHNAITPQLLHSSPEMAEEFIPGPGFQEFASVFHRDRAAALVFDTP